MRLTPIAYFEGCFPQKFGIPRQAGFAKSATGKVIFEPGFQNADFIDGIEFYSHLWLIFGFHQNRWTGSPKVRPQRLGGNKKMGLFATRSPFRPNGLGLSAVKLESIEDKNTLVVSGHDLVSGTPIFDIKPYIPFVDSIPNATSKFAESEPKCVEVDLSKYAEKQFSLLPKKVQKLIIEVLQNKPIPTYHEGSDRVYGVLINDLNVRFQFYEGHLIVISIDNKR